MNGGAIPASLDDLQGLRAARWIRESTTGQYDNFGPEAQREQQDRAIQRYGLRDTGLSWQVAHSGRTIGTTAQFAEMMAAAGRQYDVLVVGYVSRFARDLRTAVNARHDLHAAGAVILFADERILTSDNEAWDSWAREAVEAESYSRKLGKRISEGYSAKRRRLGNPGGRPPFGFVREGRPPVLHPHAETMATVADVFAHSATGARDRDVAKAVGLSIYTVRSILTNPIYIGRLRDGTPAAVGAVIAPAVWDQVQRIRAARNARGGIAARNRTYALPMLECASCGRRLIGDTGRYRHLEACPEFIAARRKSAFRNRLVRTPGHSYPAELYEGWVALAMDGVSKALGDRLLTDAAAAYGDSNPVPDELALRRVEAARERALHAYRSHRQSVRLEADMARLDAEEQRVKDAPATDRPAWQDVLAEIRDLPTLWREASPERRRDIARAAFPSIRALGSRKMTVRYWHGTEVVISVGARGMEPTVTITRAPWLEQGVEQAV